MRKGGNPPGVRGPIIGSGSRQFASHGLAGPVILRMPGIEASVRGKPFSSTAIRRILRKLPGNCLAGRALATTSRDPLVTAPGSACVPRQFLKNPGSLREPASMTSWIRQFPHNPLDRCSPKTNCLRGKLARPDHIEGFAMAAQMSGKVELLCARYCGRKPYRTTCPRPRFTSTIAALPFSFWAPRSQPDSSGLPLAG